jgi:RNA polymerase sigma factor (sigma-70 family)
LNRTGDIERPIGHAARRRAVLELIARYEAALMRTARRFSLDGGDAEDAYQRALEIVLTKAPTTDPQELIRWSQTVIKHEALAVRRSRERLLGSPPPTRADGIRLDPLALIPAPADGPDEQAERREEVARSREALRALKPAELRALGLLAEGYSYAEIGAITDYSQTKINRLLAEGRSRFRDLISRSEDGTRCRELRPLLSAFCDGEAGRRDAEIVREHLRACVHCRATLRAYRAAPRLAGALLPALPPSRSLLGRLHDLLARVGSQVSGTTKLMAACAAGTAGCVAVGVLPVPIPHAPPSGEPQLAVPPIERVAEVPNATPRHIFRPHGRKRRRVGRRPQEGPEQSYSAAPREAEAEATPGPAEYEAPAAAPVGSVASTPEPESSGSAAGEFGP